MENKNNWIPVSSGLYPEENEAVQVTYLGYNDHVPYCDQFAYRCSGEWHWVYDNTIPNIEITAWKSNCEPYSKIKRSLLASFSFIFLYLSY